MKILKFFLIGILVLVVAVSVALFVFLRNFDLNRYKPQVVEQISKAIGRNVAIDKLGLNFSALNGVVLQVDGLAIKDDPQFSDGFFARINRVELELDVQRYLTAREIVFTRVNILAPQMDLVRNAKGVLNIPAPATNDPGASGPTTASSPSTEKPVMAMPELRVKSIRLYDGKVRFQDQISKPAMDVSVNSIAVGVDNFSLNEPFSFNADAAFASNSPDLHLTGKARLDMAKSGVVITDMKFNADMDKVSLKDLQIILPQLADLGLEKLGGQLEIVCPEVNADAKGIGSLNLKVDFSGGVLSLKSLGLPLQDISFKVQATDKQADIERFFVRLGSGDLSGKAKVMNFLLKPQYEFDVELKDLLLEEILPAVAPQVKAEGKVQAQLKGSGEIALGTDPVSALLAQGGFKVEGMKIKDMNVLKMVFEKISIIPGLYEKVYASLPEDYQKKLSRDFVLFEKVDGDLSVGQGIFSLPRLDLISDVGALNAKADIDLKLNLKLESKLFIPKDLSEHIVKGTEQMAGLVNSAGQIEIPLMPFQGKATDFKPLPDMEQIGKKILVSEGRSQLQTLLEKALGVESEEAPTNPDQPQPGQTDPTPDQSPALETEKSLEKKAIEGVLDTIFKKL